ncbi:MAG: SpoIIE family protein phosphatase [Bacteroidales bacterium]|nr:SpoIIE family protein phosphatase [Bacteroidales bacterium]
MFKILAHSLFVILLINLSIKAQDISPTIEVKLENYDKSIERHKQEGNLQEELSLLNKAAFLCWNNQKYNRAIQYFQRVLEINQQSNNEKAVFLSTNYIGMIYDEIQDYNSAIKYFEQALAICKKLNKKEDLASVLINLSQTYQLLNNYNKSNQSAIQGLDIAKEINNLKFQRTFYGILAANYQSLGNSEKSIKYFDLFASIDKYLKKQQIKHIKTESQTKVNQAQAEKEQTQKELIKQTDKLKITEDSLAQAEELTREQKIQIELKESKIREQDAQLKFERLLRSFLISGFIIFLIFFIILYFLYRKIKSQKLQIEIQRDKLDLQNKKINSSIYYAQNIQNAILPQEKEINKHFEYFTIYRPKDIVSGDFYWFAELDNILFLACIDCTGHGVAGAFMSMIGNSLLNEIILEKKIKDPSKILSLLNEKIIEALRQNETDNTDGMDVCFLAIDKNKNKIEFSGAKRPLLIFNDKKKDFDEIKGDRISIGGKGNNTREFTNHTIDIKPKDIYYLSSDGLVDQNNNTRKRFGSNRLRETILNNISLSLEKQKSAIEQELEVFQGYEEQRDDITLIGFKIK